MLHVREFRIGYPPGSAGSGVLAVAGTKSAGMRAAVAFAGTTPGGGASTGGLTVDASGAGIAGRSGIFNVSSGSVTGDGMAGPFTAGGSGIRGLGTPGASGNL